MSVCEGERASGRPPLLIARNVAVFERWEGQVTVGTKAKRCNGHLRSADLACGVGRPLCGAHWLPLWPIASNGHIVHDLGCYVQILLRNKCSKVFQSEKLPQNSNFENLFF